MVIHPLLSGQAFKASNEANGKMSTAPSHPDPPPNPPKSCSAKSESPETQVSINKPTAKRREGGIIAAQDCTCAGRRTILRHFYVNGTTRTLPNVLAACFLDPYAMTAPGHHRHLARILSRRSMSLRISISTLAASLYFGMLLMILIATYFFSVRSQHWVTFPNVPSPMTFRIL